MNDPRVIRRLRRGGWVAGALLAAGTAAAHSRAQQPAALSPGPPVKGAVVLFNGTDTSRLVRRRTQEPVRWKVEDGVLLVGGGDIATKENYDNFYLHLEWMEPDLPQA